ncbi:Metallo-dependent phosphatase [Delitschia confertaspora ATCC 74209]|uniref:Metallo-dependent phosphatase n=1 Tax=Delitschia confertaspora ATCC 74209 TaxID=1513339 RepID=A0A9P4MU93_9PLEO|nr:Metallo-dependent phosphatase [Delitschia confertaspora ATCC 74209]
MVLSTLSKWSPLPQAPPPFEPASFPYLLLTSGPLKLLLYHLYHLSTYLRTPLSSVFEPRVRVVCISDTHELTLDEGKLPGGDILIHAGDLTNSGSIQEIQKQVDWLNSLPHRHVVVIAGNHDTYLDPRTRPSLPEDQRTGSINWQRVHYLQHSSLTLKISPQRPTSSSSQDPLLSSSSSSSSPSTRTLRLYGAPQIPACGPQSTFAFQYPSDADAWSETVPANTDILITHTPPKCHLDLTLPDGLGCKHLMVEVQRVKPVLHVFGHVHWGAGTTVCWWDGCLDAYRKGMDVGIGWTWGLLSPTLWWSLGKLVFSGLKELAWDKVWGGQRRSTVMVNAAQMKGNTGKLGNPVQVVDI